MNKESKINKATLNTAKNNLELNKENKINKATLNAAKNNLEINKAKKEKKKNWALPSEPARPIAQDPPVI